MTKNNLNLNQLINAKPLKSDTNGGIEEKRISKQGKDDLEKAINKELMKGWQVRSRSHDSDCTHGVTLFRKKGQLRSDTCPEKPHTWHETLARLISTGTIHNNP